MKDILNYLLKNIVDEPDEVAIEESQEDSLTHYSVTVAKQDMGKVIGKEGRVIRAIRNIMKIPAIKQGVRINISLAQTQESQI